MLRQIIDPTIANLTDCEVLFTELDPDIYSSKTSAPYHSSIGGHLRHILDIFQCVLNGLESGTVNLTDRKRGTIAEVDPLEGLKYLEKVVSGLKSISDMDPEIPITLRDNLGQGMVNVPTTLGGGLSQAHSHAIHHFACIGYLLHIYGVRLPNRYFGYNPTTPINPPN